MDSLQDRRDAFESKFAHDETLRFKALARRNKRLGLWAAEVLGHQGETAAAYADGIVQAGVSNPEAAIEKVASDVAGHGHDALSVKVKAAEILIVVADEIQNG